MTLKKSMLLIGLCLVGPALAGQAQAQYPAYSPYQGYPAYGPPVPPPSWSYDPYTSGLAACPQWYPGDPSSCRDLVPSYGQPLYHPR